MSTTPPEADVVISLADLENPIRRVVREEITRLLRRPTSILEDWRHEGPDDPTGDEALLADALDLLEHYRDDPEALMNWEDFKAELARAEAADELPD